MHKKEFYQQAMLTALNALLSNNNTDITLENYVTLSEKAHLYAEALTTKTFIEINKNY